MRTGSPTGPAAAVKIDAPLLGSSLGVGARLARIHEDAGFDGVFTFDGPHDPFSSLTMAAEHSGLDLATGVAVAFARSPMTVAQIAHDLQDFSAGRFTLGLGSQIRAHIERRFSMPWGRPVARMKEFVAALRAIFACWNHDAPLRFEGEFYRHTLMPPLLKPSPCPYGAPPILLAGVGRPMLEAAGEVADGCVIHPFHSMCYLDDFALPAIAAGRARRSDPRHAFAITVQALVVTGAGEQEYLAAREAVRAQIAFYGSTPAYRAVLEAEGIGDLQGELKELTRQGRWADLVSLIDDATLARFCVAGDPETAGRSLARRYRGLAARVAVATPMLLSDEAARLLVTGFREG